MKIMRPAKIQRKGVAPRPFNRMIFERRFEIMSSNQLRGEVSKFQRELQMIKSSPDTDGYKAERLRIANQKMILAEQYYRNAVREERMMRK